MSKNLVIGASGLVGSNLINALIDSDQHYNIGTHFKNPHGKSEQLDISQESQVVSVFKQHEPNTVFLPAGQTNVEYCETNQAETYKINVAGVKNVVDTCNTINARLIYFSTDYVFDGISGPYDEEAPANPINEYGRQKLAAEHYILLKSSNYLIVRTTVVFGWEHLGKNFIYRLIKTLDAGKTIEVPQDQVGTPTYAPDLARAAIELSFMDIIGIINVSGFNCINRYEFSLEAAHTFGLDQNLITPVSTSELNQNAKRPLLAGLNTKKVNKLLNHHMLTSREGLNRMAEATRTNTSS